MSKELEGLNLVPELRRLSIFHLPALSAHQNGEKKSGRGGRVCSLRVSLRYLISKVDFSCLLMYPSFFLPYYSTLTLTHTYLAVPSSRSLPVAGGDHQHPLP